MKFLITSEAKRKARQNRIKKEKKWIPFRLTAAVSLIAAPVFLFIGLFGVESEDITMLSRCFAAFSGLMILGVIARTLPVNFASHWIGERMNECLWIKDGMLFHFFQTSFAGGLNKFNTDETGYLFVMDINSIREAKYDVRSKRIEFHVNGKQFHYADITRGTIDKEWDLEGFTAVFYDYTDPSLCETLTQMGILFSNVTLNFKIVDYSI